MVRNNQRGYWLALIFFFWFLALLGRFYYWQVLARDRFREAFLPAELVAKILPRRGKIYSADGFPLVLNQRRYSLSVWRPNLKLSATALLEKISSIIFYRQASEKVEASRQLLLKALKNDKQHLWLVLKRHLSQGQYEALRDLHLAGLGFRAEDERFYPEGSMAAHLLGFVGRDENGQARGYFGLEGFYQRQLAGLTGYRDGEDQAAALNGRDLYLFLDRGAQFIVEEALARAIHRYRAKGGWVIVLDSRRATILAAAAWPSYNPGEYYRYPYRRFLDPIIAQTFEPGSIFKPLVMAAALNEGVVTPETRCNICDGPLTIGQYKIRTWNNKYHPQTTMTAVIKNSDNVGMVFVARRLGLRKLLDYFQKFHLGQKTGVDLQGELNVPLRPLKDWHPIDLATASFGQGIALTPIQFITAFNSLANKGMVLQPRVVREIRDRRQDFLTKPVVLSHPLKETTCEQITKMLVVAVNQGEARWTRLPGYEVAGKTGTAQIPIKGHYAKNKTIASFVGFAPAEQPRFTMLVSLQEPTSSPWGSETAAPLWFQIARALFAHWGIAPTR